VAGVIAAPIRHLVVVLGDQLDHHAAGLDGFDPKKDCIWMAEVKQESCHVPSSKQRITLFLSAMRHFAKELRARSWPLDYIELNDPLNTANLGGELKRAIRKHQPDKLIMTAPGDWRVLKEIQAAATSCSLALEIREDRHFFSTVRDFAEHARGRKQLRLEYWYRELREKTGILMQGDKPVGGQWNFDQENRGAFGKDGPGLLPKPLRFKPDAITSEVIEMVNTVFRDHPGSVTASAEGFGWPVNRKQGLQALDDFIQHRLALFGTYQDAMWTGEPWLYHAHIASALNLKLLSAQEVVNAAEEAYKKGAAPLAAVEGFIRQILGWREYVRGIYWMNMPDYLERNALAARQPLPDFFWTGDTEMTCLRESIQQTLRTGYAHHIQRLMVTGLYTLLAGIHPKAVHEWYLSVYVDAVEWVELPNVLGMSQYADGGVMASKPCAASGKYIDRMSNYCKHCRFNPAASTGKDACPITTLYWDFLMRHEALLAKNPRMVMQIRNVNRLSAADRKAIQVQAQQHRKQLQ
jgi:deoxyribodipyrimidine photolyase-related protein